ncbi:MAG TPA: GH116 family glycosyl hydrolase, partial [Clostridia bacterium]|nr:GH116 family glycosyl hydrolase [Clostridia bacterium]
NPLTAILYVAALRAMSRMAEALGRQDAAAGYRARADRAGLAVDAQLYDGEFYVQRGIVPDGHPYQFGAGCLSDQLFGQTLAHLTGLGRLLPKERLQSALRSVGRYNVLDGSCRDLCFERLFAGRDERAAVLCSWPKGGKPAFPFPYAEEVWTGVEYQVATCMLYEGMAEEALDIVKHVRKRYDGIRRNPWRETECGHHYARALASWGLLPAWCGVGCDERRTLMRPAQGG